MPSMPGELPEQNRYFDRIAPTPLVPIRLDPSGPAIWCKLEFLNPSGSTKDRIARFILEKAWRAGTVAAGDWVIEASSGSTSIAMALACAQLGLRFLAVMPEGVSDERVLMIRAYGGEVVFTPRAGGIHAAIAETHRLAAERDGFLPRQFENPENAEAHRVGTAREILAQIRGGAVDAVVSGVGTGGTLVGLFNGLRESGGKLIPVLARPIGGCGAREIECCSLGKPPDGPFSSRIPGVVDCVSTIFRREDLPGLMEINIDDEEALATTRALIRRGFPVGPSSGLNFAAAFEAFGRIKNPSARIVTVFPDPMERYFSTELFAAMKS